MTRTDRGFKLAEDTFLTVNGAATTDRSQGRKLVGRAGSTIPEALADRIGLLKQRARPADKRRRKAEDKG